jgi:hypothetical protein
MLNDYLKHKEAKLHILNSNEMEKIKGDLIRTYTDRLNTQVIQHSLRSQLLMLFYSITKVLENFPNTRKNYFMFGESSAIQTQTNYKTKRNDIYDTSTIQNDNNGSSNKLEENLLEKQRPLRLLSDDGQQVLNLWYIPHYTETLALYKRDMPDQLSNKALTYCVRIAACMNDILHFMYANACLNLTLSSSASNCVSVVNLRKRLDFTSWENAGGLETELNQLQLELNSLPDRKNPELVIELLELKRNSMLLQYECSIRYSIRERFLASRNEDAFTVSF